MIFGQQNRFTMQNLDKKFSSEDIKRAKDNFDCIEYVKQRTTRYTKYGNKILACCLFHDDHNPSMLVHRDGFQCQACDAKGDAITLVASYNAGAFLSDVKGDDFKKACEEIGAEEDIEIPMVRRDHDDEKAYIVGHIYTLALQNKIEADQYLSSRGIVSDATNYGVLTPESTKDYHEKYPFLKHYNWMCFPMYSTSENEVNHYIVGLNLRNIDSDDKEIKHRKIGQNGVFQKLDELDDEFFPIDQTIGCESATDCLALKEPATAIFGVNNASKYVFKSTAFDRDAAGINASLTQGGSMMLFDGADVADSKTRCLIDVDLENLELKLASILIFEQNTRILDSVLRTAYLASYYSLEVAAAYTVFNGMYKRTIQSMLETLYMFFDHKFQSTKEEDANKDIDSMYSLVIGLREIYDSINNEKMIGVIHTLDRVIPRRLTHKVSDAQWRAFDKNLYQPEPSIRVEDTKDLRPFKIKSFEPYIRKGGITTLAGASFSGKTTLAIFMIASIIEKNPNDKVVVYSLETNEALFRKKLAEYPFYDEHRVKVVSKLHNIGHLQQLIKTDADIGYNHFYIDNAKILYQEDYSIMDRAVRSLELIASTMCVSIVLLAQRMKSSKTEYCYIGRDEIHGGGALHDRADCVITIQTFKANPTAAELKAKGPELLDHHITFIKARAFEDSSGERPVFDFKKLNDGTSRIEVTKR